MTDEDIDYSDIPATDEETWAKAKAVYPEKQAVSLQIDTDVLNWFKTQGGQQLMNKALRQYMESHSHRR